MSPAGTVPSLAVTRAVTDLKREFADYLGAIASYESRRAQLAPQFVRTWRRWRLATGGTFIAFVRELDPAVPADKDHYLPHRSYQAALYLRRLVERPETTVGHRKTVTPYRLLGRVTRTLLVLVKPTDRDATRVAIAKASQWRGRDLERFWGVVEESGVIPLPHLPRLVKRETSAFASAVARAADRA